MVWTLSIHSTRLLYVPLRYVNISHCGRASMREKESNKYIWYKAHIDRLIETLTGEMRVRASFQVQAIGNEGWIVLSILNGPSKKDQRWWTRLSIISVVLILSLSRDKNSLFIVGARPLRGLQRSSVRILRVVWAAKGKGGSPVLLRRNRPFLRVPFEGQKIFFGRSSTRAHIMWVCLYAIREYQTKHNGQNNGQYFLLMVIAKG